MNARVGIAWSLGTALVLLAGWWGLVPKIGTAAEAEVRMHVAPDLLLPLPHPDGGVARYEAARRALEAVPRPRPRRREAQVALDLATPSLREVVDILRNGAIDRTEGIVPPVPPRWPVLSTPPAWLILATGQWRYENSSSTPFLRIAEVLADAALKAADRANWAQVERHMEASILLLDRMFESDARLSDRRGTMWIEAKVYQATVMLAAHRDLPADLAERLSLVLGKDRHGPASLSQVLRGEMQYMGLPRISAGPISYYDAGTYDPLETAELVSARFQAMIREAAAPPGNHAPPAATGMPARLQLTYLYGLKDPSSRANPGFGTYLGWPAQRIRLNVTRNSIGRIDAVTYSEELAGLADDVLRARTWRDQVIAALAVSRFRHRDGRDPRDFAELVAAGLLAAPPMDHARGEPMKFNLATLFEWRAPRGY